MTAEEIQNARITGAAIRLVESTRPLRLFAWTLAAVVGVGFVALIVTPWQQTVLGSGRVVAFAAFERSQTLAAPVGGRVRQSWVVEGSVVQAGDPIMEIVDNDPSILERLDTQRQALESQLASTRDRVAFFDRQIEALAEAREEALDAARSQVEVAEAAVRSARHALEGARAKLSQSEVNYRRQRTLADEGLVSGFEFEVAERVYREAKANASQAEQSLSAARSTLEARKSDRGRIGTEATAGMESARGARESAAVEVSALNERIASLATRISQQNTQLVKSPRSGTIFRLFAAPGAELVRAGDPLVTLIPEAESRAVEIWVPGNDVPLIEKGRSVRIQFEGWPAVQFSGWPSVAVGTFGGIVSLVDPTDDGRGRFRVLVVPDPKDDAWPRADYLRQGARAKGFVLLDRVSLGFELWRQANGFPPSVPARSDTQGETGPAGKT